MKKPEDSDAAKAEKAKGRKPAQKPKADPQPDAAASAATTQQSAAQPATRKEAAKPGTLTSTETGKGDGSSAAAGGGAIKASASKLVGDGSSDTPAATAKASDAGPKGALKDVPPEAILRDTPKADPTPTQNVTVQKTGLWQLLLGGACAAAIGAAVAMWIWPPQGGEAIDADAIRADAVAAAKEAADTQIAALREEIANAAAPEAPADTGASEAVEALKQQLEQQAQQIEELTARPALDPDMAQRVQELASQAEALEGQIKTAAEQAQSQITAAQSEAEKMQEAAADSTKRAEAVAAIASLQSALDRGVTPDEARQTLEGVGIDTPDPLTREVPSLTSLQADFPEAARAALRASARDGSTGGGNVLTNFFKAQTGARSVQPRDGADADAILSRVNAAVEGGEISDALTEAEALPDPARGAPAMADWLARAKTYADAKAALNDLSATSN